MAGLFGNGILGAYQQQGDPQLVGILSALKDAGAYLGGGGNTDNFAKFQQQNQQSQAVGQLVSGLQSDDPATRQQAYAIAPLFGVDPSAFQKQRAAQALPQLLTSMKPHQENVAALQLDNGASTPAFDYQVPGLSFTDAIAQSNSPELLAQYAPKLLDNQIAAEADASKPYTLRDGEHRFVGSNEVASLPEKPNYNAAFNSDGTPNLAYQAYERSLRVAGRDGGASGNVQSVQPLTDGTLLIVKRDGSTAHVTVDGQTVTGAKYDPNNHFALGAAGAAGKAAGTAAEAFPTVKSNFGLINDTLKGFDDPAVRAQAGKAVGYGGYLPTIPGVNSDFRARQGQLQGQAFLQAFNTLKGGGQITEVEGEKATNAITRLQKAQTPDEFYKALHEARGIFQNLYESARVRASRGAVVPALQGGGVNTPAQAAAPKPPTVSNW